MRYLVLVYWKDTGNRSAYCAQADTEEEALSFPTQGRESKILGAQAYEWPEEDYQGPKAPREKRAYLLKSAPHVEAWLTELGVLTSEAPKNLPRDESSNPRGLKKAEPRRAPLAVPWRR